MLLPCIYPYRYIHLGNYLSRSKTQIRLNPRPIFITLLQSSAASSLGGCGNGDRQRQSSCYNKKYNAEIEGNPMAVRQRRYSKEELARRGQQLYEAGIRQQVEAGNQGEIVAIDIETGDFEVGETLISATDPLFKRHEDPQLWTIRIGYRGVYHFGSRSLKQS